MSSIKASGLTWLLKKQMSGTFVLAIRCIY